MEKYYEIKVTLENDGKIIWRRIQIPADLTFSEFVTIIEITIGTYGPFFYEFQIGETLIDAPSAGADENALISSDTKIDSYLDEGVTISLIQEFEEKLEYEIVVEREVEESLDNPICIDGHENMLSTEPEDVDLEEINNDLADYAELTAEMEDDFSYDGFWEDSF